MSAYGDLLYALRPLRTNVRGVCISAAREMRRRLLVPRLNAAEATDRSVSKWLHASDNRLTRTQVGRIDPFIDASKLPAADTRSARARGAAAVAGRRDGETDLLQGGLPLRSNQAGFRTGVEI